MTVSRNPQLNEVIETFIDARLRSVHTALPARVESYDKDEQRVDVKPLLMDSFLDNDDQEISDSLPVITNVPVMFPRGGANFFISLPIVAGDFVLLVFNERSIDLFKSSNGGETDPIDSRTHDLSDAVALPGFYPFSKSLTSAHPENLTLGKDDGAQVHVKPDEVALYEENPPSALARADRTDQRISALETKLDTHIALYNSHIHTPAALIPGPSPTGPTPAIDTPVTPGSSTAADKVKGT